VLDFFAGSGTTGAVARQLDRRFVLVDDNPEAIAVMEQRLGVTPITGSAPPSRSAIAP
jgi:site-specific DNA-methyltransferase (adenine-specific)